MVNLAAFHATTFHFVQTYPGGPDALTKDCPFLKVKCVFDLTDASEFVYKGHESSLGIASSLAKQFGEDELSAKFKEQLGIYLERQLKAAGPSENCKFKTIIHGDFWYNNFMVK